MALRAGASVCWACARASTPARLASGTASARELQTDSKPNSFARTRRASEASRHAVSARDALANALRNAHGVQHVVFAPLPPIHHFPGLPQPLRWGAGSDARRHNKALLHWVQQRGGDVSLVDMETPLNAGVMAADGFHPGEPVYRYCAAAIAEHIAACVWPRLSV